MGGSPLTGQPSARHGRALVARIAEHPARLIATSFALLIVAGAALLALPVARAGAGHAPALTAIFTSASAVSVTGLGLVDTGTYWSGFGQVVILALVQVGGIGIMTVTSFVLLLIARRLGLQSRLIVQMEASIRDLASVRRLVRAVIVLSLVFEALIAVILTLRFWLGWEMSFGRAVWNGVFHAVMTFNNAGFALWPDNLTRFVTDGWVCVTVAIGLLAGGLGFPVWLELRRAPLGWRRWSLHTRLTVAMSGVLVAVGVGSFLALEWGNDRTLGPLSVPGKLLAGFFQGVTPRTAGFNTVDYTALGEGTLLTQDLLMFIGAGAAGTGGGIKVTTLAILFLMARSEIRGDADVNAFRRRIPVGLQRQAVGVTLIALVVVLVATLAIMLDSGASLSLALFEITSSFGTVGLSAGLTGTLSTFSLVVVIIVMYLGRIGPQTLAVALALRERSRKTRNAEESAIIG